MADKPWYKDWLFYVAAGFMLGFWALCVLALMGS